MGMKIIIISLCCLLSAPLLLTACSSFPKVSPHQKVFIAPEIAIELASLSLPSQNFEGEQLITAHYGDQTMAFQGQVSLSPDNFLMVLYDPFGRPGITIKWADNHIDYTKSSAVPKKLNPENVLADFVIMNWPLESIKKLLMTSGAMIHETKNHRQVMKDGKVIIDVEYQSLSKSPLKNSRIIYRHLIWSYTLNIQSTGQGL